MMDHDVDVLQSLFTATLKRGVSATMSSDQFIEITRSTKQALTKITPEYILNIPALALGKSRTNTNLQVDQHFYTDGTTYDQGNHLIRDRAGAGNDVLPFACSCNALNDKWEDTFRLLSNMVTSKVDLHTLVTAAAVTLDPQKLSWHMRFVGMGEL